MDFYGDVLVELVTAMGAALVIGNFLALIRRGTDRKIAARERVLRGRPGSPVRNQLKVATTGNLDVAPLGRTVAYLLLGVVVMIWGIASMVS